MKRTFTDAEILDYVYAPIIKRRIEDLKESIKTFFSDKKIEFEKATDGASLDSNIIIDGEVAGHIYRTYNDHFQSDFIAKFYTN